jgi:predicted transcriptional regulator
MLITVELSDATARLVHQIAEQTGRSPEAIVRELVDRSVAETPAETLPDAEVLALADMEMREDEQQELASLLDDQREGALTSTARARLAALMQVYRHGMVRKSEALKVAVLRGLRPPLG